MISSVPAKRKRLWRETERDEAGLSRELVLCTKRKSARIIGAWTRPHFPPSLHVSCTPFVPFSCITVYDIGLPSEEGNIFLSWNSGFLNWISELDEDKQVLLRPTRKTPVSSCLRLSRHLRSVIGWTSLPSNDFQGSIFCADVENIRQQRK